MDFYKIERHSSAPQIFKGRILSNRTGKAEQHNPLSHHSENRYESVRNSHVYTMKFGMAAPSLSPLSHDRFW